MINILYRIAVTDPQHPRNLYTQQTLPGRYECIKLMLSLIAKKLAPVKCFPGVMNIGYAMHSMDFRKSKNGESNRSMRTLHLGKL